MSVRKILRNPPTMDLLPKAPSEPDMATLVVASCGLAFATFVSWPWATKLNWNWLVADLLGGPRLTHGNAVAVVIMLTGFNPSKRMRLTDKAQTVGVAMLGWWMDGLLKPFGMALVGYLLHQSLLQS